MSEESARRKTPQEVISEWLLGAWMSTSAAGMEATPQDFCAKFAENIERGLDLSGYRIVQAGAVDDTIGLYALDNELVKEYTRHAWPADSVNDALCAALERGRSAPPASAEYWWITTGPLTDPLSKKIAGPFASQHEAMENRTRIEEYTGPVTFWVDGAIPYQAESDQ